MCPQAHTEKNLFKYSVSKPDVMAHSCNPSTQEAEARGSQVGDQPGLHSETLSQKKKKRKNTRERKYTNILSFSKLILFIFAPTP
jgi:hypothetical protein